MKKTNVEDAVVFVTGANRGIGKAFVEVALKMGARKIYASARNPETLRALVASSQGKVIPVALDVTSKEQIEAAASLAEDTEILINNAGLGRFSGFSTNYDADLGRQEMEVNYWGPLNTSRAFLPGLQKVGGTIVNVSSIAGLSVFPLLSTYSASKAALHSLTQGLRAELAPQGVFVAGVYPGPVDTDLAKDVQMEKESPDQVARNVFEALAKGEEDIRPDQFAVEFAKGLQSDAKAVEKQNAQLAHQPAAV